MYEVYVSLHRPNVPRWVREVARAARPGDPVSVLPVGTNQVVVRVRTQADARRAAAAIRNLEVVKLAEPRASKSSNATETTQQLPVVKKAQRALDAAEKVTEKDRNRYPFVKGSNQDRRK